MPQANESSQSPDWHAGRLSATSLSADQESREEAMQEVADTLLNIEQAIRRATRGERHAQKLKQEGAASALQLAAADLEAIRQRLFQAAFFSEDQNKLF